MTPKELAAKIVLMVRAGCPAEEVEEVLQPIVRDEREACAKLADNFVWFEADGCSPDEGNKFIATAIRGKE